MIKSTTETLTKKRTKTLPWPSQSLHLKLTEMLWQALKRAVQKRTTNLNELKRRCKDARAKIPPQRSERLIRSSRKQLIPFITATGGFTGY